MKTITKLLLTAAFLVLGIGGANTVKAGKTAWSPSVANACTWDGGTNTMSFTAVNGWEILLTGLPSGDISAYTTFHATLSSMSDNITCVRLRIKDTSGKYADVNLVNGENNVDLAALATANSNCDFTAIDDITIWSPTSAAEGKTVNGDNPASVVITNVYMYMPPTLIFDESGKAVINKDDLSATGGLTYDRETGALSSNGTEGSLVLAFAEPVDLSYLFHFNVTNSGSTGDILDKLEFYDEDNKIINTWNSIKLSNTWNQNGIDDNATNAFLNHKPVKKMVWPSAASDSKNGKTANITSVEFTLKTISCARAGETQLNTLPWIKIENSKTETPNWNMNVATDTYYGNYSSDPTHYVDLTAYEELRIYRDNNTGFRAYFINAAGTATNTITGDNATWNSEKKYWSINLSDIEKWDGKVALKAIKSGGWGVTNIVRNIVAYKTPAANAPQYSLTGSGMQLAATVAALADAKATCIDATGVKGITTNSEAGRTLLESANPNCLFLGKSETGYLANTKNVVDGTTCANLELTDGYPFKAPSNFTATAAKYTTTIDATAKAATLCLPFNAEIPEGVTAYTLSYTSGEKAEAIQQRGITADQPVLLNGNGGETVFIGSGAIKAGIIPEDGALTGIYEPTVVPTGSYVLQMQAEEPMFYQAVEGTPFTLNPFRAYLTAEPAALRAISRLAVAYPVATGIKTIEQEAAGTDIYDLQGRRVSQTTKGLYIVNGKKVIK